MQPHALNCMPTLQNPTTVTMPEELRREIARIAVEHGVAIVEDDIYGFLDEAVPPPITHFAPSVGHYVLSVSKCIAPGLRSEEHTSELQSLMRISYAVFCLKKKNQNNTQ